jgi:hypothetical protein
VNYDIKILFAICLLTVCCKSNKTATASYIDNEPPCILYRTTYAIKPEFDELKSQLSDFYNNKFTYDLLLIEKTSGKARGDIFKRLSQDSLGNFFVIIEPNSKQNAVSLGEKEYINQLITGIEEGHFIENCKGFTSTTVLNILLVRINNEIKFSFSLSRDTLEGLSVIRR